MPSALRKHAERYTKLRGFDMVINIRKETEKDYEDIKSVNDKAFGQENHLLQCRSCQIIKKWVLDQN
jgi:hypothetical protein